jgi:hypothetical protein
MVPAWNSEHVAGVPPTMRMPAPPSGVVSGNPASGATTLRLLPPSRPTVRTGEIPPGASRF